MWTDEARQFVKDRWAAGLSARQIAGALLGLGLRKSRNAVIGLVHRSGLNRNAPKRKGNALGPAKTKRAVRRTARARGLAPPLIPAQPVQEEALQPLDKELRVERLAPGQCKYPIGDPKEPGFAFCGRPVEPERPYCVHHCRVAYQPRPPQERKERPSTGAWRPDHRRLVYAAPAAERTP